MVESTVPRKLGPGQLGPGQLGPGTRLSGAQLSGASGSGEDIEHQLLLEVDHQHLVDPHYC